MTVKVRSVHENMRDTYRAGSKLAKATGAECVHALPVSMPPSGAMAPREVDWLLVRRKGDEFSAVAKFVKRSA